MIKTSNGTNDKDVKWYHKLIKFKENNQDISYLFRNSLSIYNVQFIFTFQRPVVTLGSVVQHTQIYKVYTMMQCCVRITVVLALVPHSVMVSMLKRHVVTAFWDDVPQDQRQDDCVNDWIKQHMYEQLCYIVFYFTNLLTRSY